MIKPSIKWVGFDMDECLGTLYPLYVYCEKLMDLIHDDQLRNNFYFDMIQILSNEIFIHKNHNLWIFRPQFDRIIDVLIAAYENGQITGCFILSNNGSNSLVLTAQLILNSAVAKKTNNRITNLFKEAWSAKSSCRKNSIVKSWNVVQTCLLSTGLPIMNNPSTDLLFFDDKLHPSLKKELGDNFIQVSPYFNYTPYQNIFSILKPLFEKYKISNTFRQEIKSIAEDIEIEDLNLIFNDSSSKQDERYSLKTPSVKIQQQISEFMEPLLQFIASSPKYKNTNMLFQKTIKSSKKTKVKNISIKRTPFMRGTNRKTSIWSRY